MISTVHAFDNSLPSLLVLVNNMRERQVDITVVDIPEDLEANEYLRMAHRYIEVLRGTNNNNFANVDLIVELVV
ncbi:hypothetical protein FB446DRAFT_791606 [Lentinula raphanica]|nr:hypothetical protein FB446DRAFT_791606 [Lentinula raphanica]